MIYTCENILSSLEIFLTLGYDGTEKMYLFINK